MESTLFVKNDLFRLICCALELKWSNYAQSRDSYDDYFDDEKAVGCRVLSKTNQSGECNHSGLVVYADRNKIQHVLDWVEDHPNWLSMVERHKTKNGNTLCYCHIDNAGWYEDSRGQWLSSIESPNDAIRAVRWARTWVKDTLTVPLELRLKFYKWKSAKAALAAIERDSPVGLFETMV